MMNHPGVPTRWVSALVLFATFAATRAALGQELLSLNVNRTTGAASISNPATNTAPIVINGYSILSSLGALKPADGQWSSFDDQNIDAASWIEAAPTVTDLSELNPLSSHSFAVSDAPSIGSIYQQVVPAFGVDPDHLTFEYNVVGGTTTTTGIVAYSGTKLTNDLLLTVNTTNGQVQLKNDSPYDVFIDGYAVYSVSASLQEINGKWNSLDDQNVGGAGVWEEAFPSPSAVSELKQNGSMRLTPGSGYALGELYNFGTGVPDLRLEFLQPGALTPTEGTVAYGAFAAAAATSAGVLADFDNNGVVDARDSVLWRNSVGTTTVLRNDPIGGVIGTGQFNLWKANFGNSTAGGAGAVLASVPEPGSAVLLLTMMVGLLWHRGGQRPKCC